MSDMKSALYYVLSAAHDALAADIVVLHEELKKIDPIESMGLRFRIARMEGTLQYMKKELKQYE